MFLKIVEGLSGCYYLISFELCVWVQRCVSPLADSDAACRCVWVCMAACGGGGDGRKSIVLSWHGVLMIGSLYPVCLRSQFE